VEDQKGNASNNQELINLAELAKELPTATVYYTCTGFHLEKWTRGTNT